MSKELQELQKQWHFIVQSIHSNSNVGLHENWETICDALLKPGALQVLRYGSLQCLLFLWHFSSSLLLQRS
ncbi:hypothetical protein CIB84_015162 [Bambusicola thoracicus]|uniref:Uncharacterized protein n=1 Tax=Bambusicola thoracicus TaxID=9083 RepID=A0A2P4SAE2_BAMTH|nr:hypothetical protein CIB84_015162 [Bambusicola thoracicus]